MKKKAKRISPIPLPFFNAANVVATLACNETHVQVIKIINDADTTQ